MTPRIVERSLVYLAVPYSHPDPAIRQQRFEAVNVVAAKLMLEGLHIFSPISHTHPIALAGDLPTGFDFWEQYDRAILETCRQVLVLMLDGWKESKGVTAEIAMAQKIGIPVDYLPV